MDEDKAVVLVFPGAEGDDIDEGRDAMVGWETTVADLLEAADRDPSRWGLELWRNGEHIMLTAADKVYDYIEESGEKLYVQPLKRMEVGR